MILGPEQAGVEDSQYILKATSDFVALCATCDANGNTCSICSEKNYSALKAAAFQYNPKRLAVVIIKGNVRYHIILALHWLKSAV